MSTEIQVQQGTALEPTRAVTPMELIQEAMRGARTPEEKQAATGIVKELIALQQSMQRFEWEAQERQDGIDFGNALNACQSKIGRIAPNVHRENNIWWADYAQIDRTIRPIYIEAGFSIGFSEAQGTDSTRLRMCATVTRGRITRDYFAEISRTPASSKMSQADADASAASRVKRYLMLDIFNIAIGIDKDEKGGVPAGNSMPEETVIEYLDALDQAPDLNSLKSLFSDCWGKAKKLGDLSAKKAFQDRYEAAKRRMQP
jgi:hypothetical protein